MFVSHDINWVTILQSFKSSFYLRLVFCFQRSRCLIINEWRFVVGEILALRHLNRTSSLFDKTASGNPNLKEKLNCVASSVNLLLSVFTWQGSIRLCLRVCSEETVCEWLMPWICSWLPFLKAENHQEEALKIEIGYLCSIMKLYCARVCMTLVILVPFFLASKLVL